MAGHCIDQLTIELRTEDVALAEQMIERVSRLHERGLAQVIDRVCSELSGPARLDRIERLELELGPLAVDDLEGDFLREVERALRAALQKQLTGRGSAGPRWRASLELLDVFARTGNLPWWADRGQPALVAEHLRAVLADAPEELMRWLRGRAHDARALRRLARHVDDAWKAALVERADLDGAAKLRAEGRGFAGEGPAPSRGHARPRGALPSAPARSDTGGPEALMQAVLRALAAPSPRGHVDAAHERIAGQDRARIAQEARGRIANGDSDEIPNEDSARSPNDDGHGIAQEDSARRPNDDSAGIAKEEHAWPPNHDSAGIAKEERAWPPNHDSVGIANAHGARTTNDHSDGIAKDDSARPTNDRARPTNDRAWPTNDRARPTNDSARPTNDRARPTNDNSHGIAKDQSVRTPNDDSAPIANATREPPATPASEHRARQRRDPLPSRARSPEHARGTQPPRPPAREPLDHLYLDNAGLVILWPFLERFFVRTGLADLERRFLGERATMQAIALLSQLASEDPEPPEYRLPLAKLLCGVSPDSLFELDDPLSPEAIAECEQLLAAVVANAPILRGMPAAEFRAAFLQRAAVLTVRDGAWLLRVERQSHDLVLDRFPWSWSWVKLPWMPDPLRVEW